MQPRFLPPSLSAGLHAAGPFPSGPAATMRILFVMATGAVFGIAAQVLLQRLGLSVDSIRDGATPHFAFASWARR